MDKKKYYHHFLINIAISILIMILKQYFLPPTGLYNVFIYDNCRHHIFTLMICDGIGFELLYVVLFANASIIAGICSPCSGMCHCYSMLTH